MLSRSDMRLVLPCVAVKDYCGGLGNGLGGWLGHAPPMGRFSSVRESYYGRFFCCRNAGDTSTES